MIAEVYLKNKKMKKLIKNIFGIGLILVMVSCMKKEFPKPTVDLELMANTVHLNINSAELASATVNIKYGNGEYTVESSDETVAIVSNAGVEITITALREGVATVTVQDAHGKTATIDVTASVSVPTTPTFTWNGQAVEFDKPGGYGITILSDKVALTDIINDQKQYVLSWTGGFSEGEKTDGMLAIVSAGAEPEIKELATIKVLKSESSNHYIVFSDGTQGGELYFSRE